MPANNSPRFTMRLEPHEKEALEALAEKQGTTMAELVRPFVLRLLRVEPTDPRQRGRPPTERKQ